MLDQTDKRAVVLIIISLALLWMAFFCTSDAYSQPTYVYPLGNPAHYNTIYSAEHRMGSGTAEYFRVNQEAQIENGKFTTSRSTTANAQTLNVTGTAVIQTEVVVTSVNQTLSTEILSVTGAGSVVTFSGGATIGSVSISDSSVAATSNNDIFFTDDAGNGITVEDGGRVLFSHNVRDVTTSLHVSGSVMYASESILRGIEFDQAIAAVNDMFYWNPFSDPDNGSWLKQYEQTSMGQELGPWPVPCLLIGSNTDLDIYNCTTGVLYAQFEADATNDDVLRDEGVSSIAALNGVIALTGNDVTKYTFILDLRADKRVLLASNGAWLYSGNLSQRNDGLGQILLNGNLPIVSNVANDIALIEKDGQLIPVIATDGGVSVVRIPYLNDRQLNWQSATVVDIAPSGGWEDVNTQLTRDGDLYVVTEASPGSKGNILAFYTLPTSDLAFGNQDWRYRSDVAGNYPYPSRNSTGAETSILDIEVIENGWERGNIIVSGLDEGIGGSGGSYTEGGVSLIYEYEGTEASGGVQYIDVDETTPILWGDVKTAITGTKWATPTTIYNSSINAATFILNASNSVSDVLVSGVRGTAFEFDNDTGKEYLEAYDSDDFSFGDGSTDSPFSISCWVKFNTVLDAQGLVSKVDINGASEYAVIISGGKVFFRIYDNSVSPSAHVSRYYNTALSNGVWYHLVFTYDGRGGASAHGGIDIWLNGVKVDDTDTTSGGPYVAMENTAATLKIGPFLSSYPDAVYDEVVISGTVWSEEMIRLEYQQGLKALANHSGNVTDIAADDQQALPGTSNTVEDISVFDDNILLIGKTDGLTWFDFESSSTIAYVTGVDVDNVASFGASNAVLNATQDGFLPGGWAQDDNGRVEAVINKQDQRRINDLVTADSIVKEYGHFERLTADELYMASSTIRPSTIQASEAEGVHVVDNDGNGIFVADGGSTTLKISQNTNTEFIVENSNTGTAAFADVSARNGSAIGDGLNLRSMGTGYTTNGAFVQDAGVLEAGANLSGGLSILARNGSAPIRFYTGGFADANERVRIDSSGNVGIGTDSPDWPLVLAGNFGGEGLRIDSSSGAGILVDRGSTSNSASLGFQTAGVAKAYIGLDNDVTDNFHIGDDSIFTNKWVTINAASGNVGFGTDSPVADVEMMEDDTGDSQSVYIGALGNQDSSLWFVGDRDNNGSGVEWAGISFDYSEDRLHLHTSDSRGNHIVIDSDGDTGFGTDSPEGLAHLFRGDANNAPGATADDLVIEGTGTDVGMTIMTSAANNSNIFFADTDHDYAGYIQYGHISDAFTLGAGGAAIAEFNSGGQVVLNGVTQQATYALTLDSSGYGYGAGWHVPSTLKVKEDLGPLDEDDKVLETSEWDTLIANKDMKVRLKAPYEIAGITYKAAKDFLDKPLKYLVNYNRIDPATKLINVPTIVDITKVIQTPKIVTSTKVIEVTETVNVPTIVSTTMVIDVTDIISTTQVVSPTQVISATEFIVSTTVIDTTKEINVPTKMLVSKVVDEVIIKDVTKEIVSEIKTATTITEIVTKVPSQEIIPVTKEILVDTIADATKMVDVPTIVSTTKTIKDSKEVGADDIDDFEADNDVIDKTVNLTLTAQEQADQYNKPIKDQSAEEFYKKERKIIPLDFLPDDVKADKDTLAMEVAVLKLFKMNAELMDMLRKQQAEIDSLKSRVAALEKQ